MASNGDEALDLALEFSPGGPKVIAIGNFHKTLPHNDFGEVDPGAYRHFKDITEKIGSYENVAQGANPADRLANPQAARARDKLTGGGGAYDMPPAPKVLSRSTAAEFTELQWMAILRDLPFADFAAEFAPGRRVAAAIDDLTAQFSAALAADGRDGLRLGQDLPKSADGKLDIGPSTLFRCGLPDEDKGPLVSQFFLHDIAYGAQFIIQKVRPYRAGRDFLTDHQSWLRAQNSGLDAWGHGYLGDNDFNSEPALEEPGGPRRLTTMRDICRFVNKDALHQAYFNAALLCLSWKIPWNAGNPYLGYARQGPFGTFGGPDILTRVSEVAGRALAVVWRQKWEVHRRLRPEAYGGLMQMQAVGYNKIQRAYGLPAAVFETAASKLLSQRKDGSYFLPMAFTAGSPAHPSYGAGHATVAGACVTVLKAWFDGAIRLQDWLAAHPARSPLPDAPANESPVVISETDRRGGLIAYGGADAREMTVQGELNKLAANVAMGRTMGGVHWRSDNTRSLRLGEQIAVEALRSESEDYAERGKADAAAFWAFRSFGGKAVRIAEGKVTVDGAPYDRVNNPL